MSIEKDLLRQALREGWMLALRTVAILLLTVIAWAIGLAVVFTLSRTDWIVWVWFVGLFIIALALASVLDAVVQYKRLKDKYISLDDDPASK